MRGSDRLVRAAALALVLASGTALAQPAPPPPPAGDAKQQCVQSFEGAQKLRDQRRLIDARKELIACGQQQCPEVVRTKCIEWLREVEKTIPSIIVRVVDPYGRDATDATLSVDGRVVARTVDGKPIQVDPGQHDLMVELPGAPRPVVARIVASEGEQYRSVVVSFQPQWQPGPPGPPGWTPPPPLPPPTPPEEVDYYDGMNVPDGYVKEERIRKGLVIGGAVTFGTLWLVSIVTAALLQGSAGGGELTKEEITPLYFPIAGPFIAAGTMRNGSDSDDNIGTVFLVLDGALQTGMFAMMLGGIFSTKTVLVRSPLAVTPSVGPGHAGLVLDGTF
jgi:hypothetical protein